MQETLNETPKSNNVLDIIKTPFVILYNILAYSGVGIKATFFDLWVNLYNGASYQVDKTYRHTKQQFMEEEDKIYEMTKKKPKKEKVYKYSAKTLAKLEEEKKELMIDLQNAGATRSKVPHVYLYKVRDASGRIITGTMNGLSKLDINSYLINEGYDIYSIKTSPFIDFVYKDSSFMGKKMSTKDLIFWLTQLSTYIKAGLTLNESIKILTSQMKGNKARTTAFKAISYELTLGESFSSALEKQGTMFPALLINMIKAAEASGTLVETLDDMSDYYTEINETRRQMVSAMTYPAIISIFAIGVVIFILSYIVPQFTDIYAQNGTEITGITKIVVDASSFLQNNYMLLIGIILAVVVIIIVLYKANTLYK